MGLPHKREELLAGIKLAKRFAIAILDFPLALSGIFRLVERLLRLAYF